MMATTAANRPTAIAAGAWAQRTRLGGRTRLGVRGRGFATSGFTMIELIVVIAIMMMAAGMMAPSIASFLKNRQLSRVLTELRSTINAARLRAVNERSRVTLVFFREGARVYDHRERRFVDEYFEPENSPLAAEDEGQEPSTWYSLGFQGGALSTDVREYEKWAAEHLPRDDAAGTKRTRRRSRAEEPELDLSSQPRILFERDGSVKHETGTDVMSTFYRKEPPVDADIIVYSAGNSSAGFIDIRPNGQNSGKMAILTDYLPTTPSAMKEHREQGGAKSTSRRKRASR